LTDLAPTREIGLLFGADRRLPARPALLIAAIENGQADGFRRQPV